MDRLKNVRELIKQEFDNATDVGMTVEAAGLYRALCIIDEELEETDEIATICWLEEELNSFEDVKYKKLALELLEGSPEYFWEAPASSSGKHHPSYTVTPSGLVKHVKAATQILNHILSLDYTQIIPQDIRDCMRVAILIHDCEKMKDKKSGTNFEHPLSVADRVLSYRGVFSDIPDELIEVIADLCASHMGQWNTSTHNVTTLPLPDSFEAYLVHLADYLASRKNVEIKFLMTKGEV